MSEPIQIRPPGHHPALSDSRKGLQGGGTPHSPAAPCCRNTAVPWGDRGWWPWGHWEHAGLSARLLLSQRGKDRSCCYKPKPSHNSQMQVLQELLGFATCLLLHGPATAEDVDFEAELSTKSQVCPSLCSCLPLGTAMRSCPNSTQGLGESFS